MQIPEGPTAPTPPILSALTTYLLSRTGKAARGAFAAQLAASGLRLWHMAVLAALADSGPHAQRELSARLGVDPSDMVKVVDELAARGWAERTRDPADRRRARITLTPAGRDALTAQVACAEVVQDAVLAPLDAAERAVLHGLLARVHAGLDGRCAPAGPRPSGRAARGSEARSTP